TVGGIDYRVWTMALPGGAVETQTSGRVDFDPAWGGSGWIYFCRGTYEPPNIPEIWRVRPSEVSSMRAVTAEPSVYKYSLSVGPSDDWVVSEGRLRTPMGSPGRLRPVPEGRRCLGPPAAA